MTLTTKDGDRIVLDDDTAAMLCSREFRPVLRRIQQRRNKAARTAPPIAAVALVAFLCWLLSHL